MLVIKMIKKYLDLWYFMILKIVLILILLSIWFDKYIDIFNLIIEIFKKKFIIGIRYEVNIKMM